MAKNSSIQNVMEVIMASSDKNDLSRKAEMLKKGTIRKIAPKVYTTNMEDTPEEIIRRNLFYILGQLYPRAVISHRSAYELKPTTEGDIFLTYTYTKNISLPGIKVHLLQGPQGTEHDMPFLKTSIFQALNGGHWKIFKKAEHAPVYPNVCHAHLLKRI